MGKEKEANNTPTPKQYRGKGTTKKKITQVIEYFSVYDGSTLSCADYTGISRCSVCYYVHDLLVMGFIGFIGRFQGRTGRMMKTYSSNKSKWLGYDSRQMFLFDMEGWL